MSILISRIAIQKWTGLVGRSVSGEEQLAYNPIMGSKKSDNHQIDYKCN